MASVDAAGDVAEAAEVVGVGEAEAEVEAAAGVTEVKAGRLEIARGKTRTRRVERTTTGSADMTRKWLGRVGRADANVSSL